MGMDDFEVRKGSALAHILVRTLRILVLVLMAGTVAAGAQAPTAGASDGAGGDDPVAQVRKSQAFEIGPFVNGGTGLGNRNNYQFLSAGVQGGKILTPVIGHGLLAGQFE